MKVDLGPKTTINFGRRLTVNETKAYTKAVNDGLTVLDKKICMIVHNSTVPSIPTENTGIGSLLSRTAEKYFIPFLKSHAFTTIQQEPNTKRGPFDPSPYSPISNAKNIFMIPLERLASEEYVNILSDETFARLFENQSFKKSNDVNYTEVAKNYDVALWESYRGLHSKMDDPLQDSKRLKTSKLMASFNDFKSKNSRELVPQAIYEVLVREYNDVNWRNWGDVDKNLYDTMPSIESIERLQDLKSKYKTEIDFFLFKQWLTEREIARANKFNAENGIKVIADSPIAFSLVEEWQNKDLFMDGLSLGCPPDYYAPGGQRWDFSVLRPEMIFKPDGSIGRGGELLKKRYEKMFESAPGGVRIDHVIGLIDPFIYTNADDYMNEWNSGRIYSTPDKPLFSRYAKRTIDDFAAILTKIVIPAAEKYGLSKDDLICEDLGCVTQPVRDVMNKLGLSGLAVTEHDARGKFQPEKNVIMLGSHDNASFVEYTNGMFAWKNDHFYHKTHCLAEDTLGYNQDYFKHVDSIRNDKTKFMTAMFTELFASPVKKIQVFFTDFFGIGRTYNRPGSKEGCWTLRIPENYETLYHENLQNGIAMNLPEAIANAIKNRGQEFVQKHSELLKKLEDFANILKSE